MTHFTKGKNNITYTKKHPVFLENKTYNHTAQDSFVTPYFANLT